MADLSGQLMNQLYSYNEPCKNSWYTGCGGTLEDAPADLTAFDATKAEWSLLNNDVRYADDLPGRSTHVNEGIFTLPLPAADVTFNPHLLEPAQSVDVRAEYVYNF